VATQGTLGVGQTYAERALIRAAVRQRDGYRCTKCGITEQEHKDRYGVKSLHVHRLVPGSLYSLKGCISLCCVCHGMEPNGQPGDRDLSYRKARTPEQLSEIARKASQARWAKRRRRSGVVKG
jgi:5-methylcytosine-specific restriction endonuclease McrA